MKVNEELIDAVKVYAAASLDAGYLAWLQNGLKIKHHQLVTAPAGKIEFTLTTTT